MNKKLVAAVIAAVVLIGAMTGCVDKETPTPAPTTPTPAPTTPTPAPTTPTPVSPVTTTSCDMCHKTESTANLEAHVKGGLLVNGQPGCFGYWGCHGVGNATVHTVHPSDVGCAACHHGKEAPAIPPKGPGGTTCELCHAMPNPLESSDGRLVEIHLERGKDCTVCHIGEISEIHGLK